MQYLIEVADLMSTPWYTPASGRGRKAAPPKRFRDCRRELAGTALNRRRTVTYLVCGALSTVFFVCLQESLRYHFGSLALCFFRITL